MDANLLLLRRLRFPVLILTIGNYYCTSSHGEFMGKTDPIASGVYWSSDFSGLI
jgi:hypothetical protein